MFVAQPHLPPKSSKRHIPSTMSLTSAVLFALLCLHATTAIRLPHSTRQNTICPVILPFDVPTRQLTSINRQAVVPRIVGGDFVTSSRIASVLAVIADFDFTTFCTGSVISSFWVISAAHCEITTDFIVTVGATEIAFDGTDIPIARVIDHPQYRDGFNLFDITLVQLQQPAPPTNFMLINSNPSLPAQGSFARVAGFGVTVFTGEEEEVEVDPSEADGILRQVDVPVASMFLCRQFYNGDGDDLDPASQLCLGYDRGGCDSCQGDSGGPAFQYDANGNPVQVGVVSFGFECAAPGAPGVYIRISNFIPWMQSQGAMFTTTLGAQSIFGGRAAPVSAASSGLNIAAVVGGVIAGVSLLALVVLGVLWTRRNHANNSGSIDAHQVEDEAQLERPATTQVSS